METNKKMKMMSLDQLKDKHLGEVGTIERDKYEFDLKIEILGDMIKSVRKERHLTQEQLGDLIGVQKSQISKLERNTRNVTIETILKVFKALKANVKFTLTNDLQKASVIIGSTKHLQQNSKLNQFANEKKIPVYSFDQISIYELTKFIKVIT